MRASVYRPANSISEIMGTPFSASATIRGAVSGIPGLFTTSSASIMRSTVCLPSSHAIPYSSSICLYLSLIDDMSETKTSWPFTWASTAAPTPLSPAPNTTILFFFISFCYRIFKVTNVITAKIIPTIQNRVTILVSGITCKGRCIKASIPALPGF